jgi:DNA-binding transcriptional MerR regulator
VAGLYKVQEFAELAGVTVRALHHYDRLALLRPRRTASGYRQYGIHELERLEQIVALKFLGLPLKQIKSLLDRDVRELSDALRLQRQALEGKRQRLNRVISAIREAEKEIQPGKQTNPAVLKKIIEVIEMEENMEFTQKYYSEEAQAKLAVKRQEWTPELQEQISKQWNDLFRDVEASLNEDPASEKAQALGARWKALVGAFTGGDPEVTAGLSKAWADRPNWSATMQQQTAPFSNPKIWEYMNRVMGCRK